MMEFSRLDPVRVYMALLRSGVIDSILDAKRINEHAVYSDLNFKKLKKINEKLTERLRTLEADVDDDARAQDRFMEILDLKYFIFEGLRNPKARNTPYFQQYVISKFLDRGIHRYERDYWMEIKEDPEKAIQNDPNGVFHFVEDLIMRNREENREDADKVLTNLRYRIGPMLHSSKSSSLPAGNMDVDNLKDLIYQGLLSPEVRTNLYFQEYVMNIYLAPAVNDQERAFWEMIRTDPENAIANNPEGVLTFIKILRIDAKIRI